MATVNGITAARAQAIEDASVVSGTINVNGHLILTTAGGTTIDAGLVVDSVNSGALALHEADTTVHGVTTGELVGTLKTQTLSAKTLTTPTIASFINAQHDHSAAASGGAAISSGVTIGVANAPAPVTVLNSVVLSDGDPAKTLASLTLTAGRWLILGSCEGVTLSSGGTRTRFSYDLKSTQTTFVAKAVAGSSDGTGLDAGRTVFGWLENSATSTITFTIIKNGNGALVTTSTLGSLVAIRMG